MKKNINPMQKSPMDQKKIAEAIYLEAEKVPLNKYKVLFIGKGGGFFVDNCKYAFIQACRKKYSFAPVFGTSFLEQAQPLMDAGLPVTLFNRATFEDLASYGTIVCDDFWWKDTDLALICHRAEVLQLWNGLPLKKIGLAEMASKVNMTPEKAAKLKSYYSGYKAVPATSKFVSQQVFPLVFSDAEFPVLGFPRNDILLRTPQKADLLNVDTGIYEQVRAAKRTGKKIVLYAPTYRDTGGDPFIDSIDLDIMSLAALAKDSGILFILKFHPTLQVNMEVNLPDLILYPSHMDIYPLLRQVDILITDYSSIYFDYLLLDRPVLFHIYDFDKYRTQDREFLLDFESYTPGEKSMNNEGFFDSLRGLISGKDNYKEERLKVREKIFESTDANSSTRICNFIEETMISRA